MFHALDTKSTLGVRRIDFYFSDVLPCKGKKFYLNLYIDKLHDGTYSK
jgi:hypothetical protein